jgi:hypothetical protein
MRKFIYVFMFLFPVVIFAQQSGYKSSPLDYLWQYVGDAGFSSGPAYYTSLAFSPVDGQPYVAYMDVPAWGGTTGPATVKKFDGTNWVYVGNAGFTVITVGYTSLAFSPVDSLPYVAYGAGCSSGNQATVMKFDGTGWVHVGGGGFSQGTAAYTSLSFNPVNGQPYVAYLDFSNSDKTSVMRFDGTSWVNVGSPGFSAGEAQLITLAFSPSGIPYVAFEDMVNSEKITVMSFNGTDWTNVGPAGFSLSMIADMGFAVSPVDGQPYVAYQDYGNYGRATVMKFDGTNWVNVGNAGVAGGFATKINLAFNKSHQLYLSYWESSYPGMSLMKFDGTNWLNVGNTSFTAGYLDYPGFAFSPSDDPYLAYSDEADSLKATVMKCDFPEGIIERQPAQMLIYPNPAKEKLTIETPPVSTKTDLTIMNLNGVEILSQTVTGPKTQLDLSSLPAGVYLVRLTNDRTAEIGKIIKQ